MSKSVTTLNFDDDWFEDNHASQIQQWIEVRYHEFIETSYFEQLDNNAKENASFIINIFFDYCYSYFLVSPDRIRNDMIEEIMLDLFPRKVSADKETFIAFESVVISFLLWCQENNFIKHVDNICSTIKLLAPKMIERSQDSSAWGIAKSFFFGKSPEVNLDDFNIPEHIPIRRESPKIGRNDSCPCGSGKKYKKCCGAN